MAGKTKETRAKAKARTRGNRIHLGWSRLAAMLGVGALSAAGAVGAVALLVWAGLVTARSPYFRLQEIEIDPGRHYRAEEILERIDFPRGASLLLLDTSTLAAELGAFPWVREARLRKRFPGVLEIHLIEREPVLVASVDRKLWFIDEDGAPIASAEPGDAIDLPVVTGRDARALTSPAPFGDEVKVLQAARRTSFGASLEEIHVDEGGSRTLVLADGAVRVRVGESLDDRRLARIERVLKDLSARGELPATIDVDYPDSAVVTLKAAAEARLNLGEGSHGG